MFSLFRKQQSADSADQPPALISVHIPKTAGTSFRNLLKSIYGEAAVIRLDIPILENVTRLNEREYSEVKLPQGVRVIHGHFNPLTLHQRFELPPDLPVITWLRDPVDRVISNYFYLEKRLREELDEAGKQLNILSKMQRSLLEYARAEINRNRQSKFLAGYPLEDFAFVGIQEHYTADVIALGKEFFWPERPVPQHNITGGKQREVSDAVRAEIAALNAADVQLYEKGLALRAARQQTARLDLVSIHIPKTGGTSFYRSLRDVYGHALAPAFRRRDLQHALERFGSLEAAINGHKRVLHGHFHYAEVAALFQDHRPKLICWLRDPAQRVLSNYRFFQLGLQNPARNPENYRLNKHRKKESLLTYAAREENRNVMTRFLAGSSLADYFFVGFLEHYTEDLARLGRLLEWPEVEVAHLNPSNDQGRLTAIDPATKVTLEQLNAEDLALYRTALEARLA